MSGYGLEDQGSFLPDAGTYLFAAMSKSAMGFRQPPKNNVYGEPFR
jgi:hypothetical protein